MPNFKFTKTNMKDVMVIEPTVFQDQRGYFMEAYHEQSFHDAGIEAVFVQDNQSSSKKGVLRGLHFQIKHPQAKLIRVLQGEIFDVIVDMRKEEPTYGQAFHILLSHENQKQLYIPKDFAHGFLVLSDIAEILYKCTDYYHPEDEGGIIWNDETLAIDWPLHKVEGVVLSKKDGAWDVWKK